MKSSTLARSLYLITTFMYVRQYVTRSVRYLVGIPVRVWFCDYLVMFLLSLQHIVWIYIYICIYRLIILFDNCRCSLPVGLLMSWNFSTQRPRCLWAVTYISTSRIYRFATRSLNMVRQSRILSAARWTEARGPRLTAHWKSSVRWIACWESRQTMWVKSDVIRQIK